MRDGPRGFNRDFSCPGLLRILLWGQEISGTGLSPSLAGLPMPFPYSLPHPTSKSYNPRPRPGLGCSRFARRYSGNRVFFLFLQVLRCFSSLGLSPMRLCIQRMVPALHRWRVSPFGHPRIIAHFQLPEAFRRLSRPSSTPSAKASSVRPCSLNLLALGASDCSFGPFCCFFSSLRLAAESYDY